jgi:hypothetical protein
MIRLMGHALLWAWLALAPVAAQARDIASWTIGLPRALPEQARRGLVCRTIDSRTGLIEVRILDRAAQIVFLQDDHGGFYLIRSFEKPDGTFDPRDVPDRIRIDLFRDLTALTTGEQPAEQIPLLNRPGRYWLVATANHETEIENIEWIDACQFTVSGASPAPNWRISAERLPADEAQPTGLRCHIVDPANGIIEIGITDKRARTLYVRDDHGGSYLVRNFERPDPHGRADASTFDQRLVPDTIRVDLFHDLSVSFSKEDRTPRVPLVFRPGDYRIVSADDSDGELSLTDWLGKCALRVK